MPFEDIQVPQLATARPIALRQHTYPHKKSRTDGMTAQPVDMHGVLAHPGPIYRVVIRESYSQQTVCECISKPNLVAPTDMLGVGVHALVRWSQNCHRNYPHMLIGSGVGGTPPPIMRRVPGVSYSMSATGLPTMVSKRRIAMTALVSCMLVYIGELL